MGTVTRLFDGLANVLTGRGTTVDRAVHNFWVRRFHDPSQIEAAYLASWLHRKIVDIPAQDMTRAGRDWDAEDDQIAAIEKEEKRLGYWQKLYEALTLGRLGGGAILIGLGDDPSQPLPSTIGVGQIRYLTVLSRWELSIGDMETDPESDNFRGPRKFTLSGTGRQIDVHPSRVVCFKGLPILSIRNGTSWEDRFWGMSVVEACDEAVQQATAACSGFASLIDEAKVDIFRFDKLYETLGQPNGEDRIKARVELTNTGKSTHRAVILDKEDEWEQRQLTLAGVRDVIITYDARVAGAADIPATRLFGKAPDGQNSTGESDLLNYYQGLGGKQDMQLRPSIERLDAVMLPSAGVPADLPWSFSTLNVLTEQQAAEIESKEATSVTSYANSGMIPESALAKAVQNRMIESGRWPGLKKAIDEAEAAGEGLPEDEPDPSAIQAEGGDPSASAGTRGRGSAPAARAANDRKTEGAPEGGRPFDDGNPYRWGKGQRGGQFKSGPGGGGSPLDFIIRALLGAAPQKQRPIGKVSASAARLVKRKTGLAIEGKEIRLDHSGLTHAWKGHGPSGKVVGAKPLRRGDLLRGTIGINSATQIEPGTSRGRSGQRFQAVMKAGRDQLHVVYETNSKAVYVVTMWRK